jgi:hypothetical protein
MYKAKFSFATLIMIIILYAASIFPYYILSIPNVGIFLFYIPVLVFIVVFYFLIRPLSRLHFGWVYILVACLVFAFPYMPTVVSLIGMSMRHLMYGR